MKVLEIIRTQIKEQANFFRWWMRNENFHWQQFTHRTGHSNISMTYHMLHTDFCTWLNLRFSLHLCWSWCLRQSCWCLSKIKKKFNLEGKKIHRLIYEDLQIANWKCQFMKNHKHKCFSISTKLENFLHTTFKLRKKKAKQKIHFHPQKPEIKSQQAESSKKCIWKKV